jgi:hypothetical protein
MPWIRNDDGTQVHQHKYEREEEKGTKHRVPNDDGSVDCQQEIYVQEVCSCGDRKSAGVEIRPC